MQCAGLFKGIYVKVAELILLLVYSGASNRMCFGHGLQACLFEWLLEDYPGLFAHVRAAVNGEDAAMVAEGAEQPRAELSSAITVVNRFAWSATVLVC